MFLQDLMAKNRFLHILAHFYTLKMARNLNGLPPIVYWSINLTFFRGFLTPVCKCPANRKAQIKIFDFLAHPNVESFVKLPFCLEKVRETERASLKNINTSVNEVVQEK